MTIKIQVGCQVSSSKARGCYELYLETVAPEHTRHTLFSPSDVSELEGPFVAPFYLALIDDAIEHSIWLRIAERPEVKEGFSASPRRQMVEPNFA